MVMLLEFSCSNHRSIKDKVTFSMLAGTDDTMKDCLRKFSNYRVLPSAVIYGANGSGKSSLIDALCYMAYMVCHSHSDGSDGYSSQTRHMLSPADAPSEYKIQFAKNGVRYAYGFSILQGSIEDEYLFCFPNGKKVTVFEREGTDVKPGNRFGGSAFAQCIKYPAKSGELFLSHVYYSGGGVKETSEAFEFFGVDLIVFNNSYEMFSGGFGYYNYNIRYMTYGLNGSLKMLRENEELKNSVVEVLQELGTGVKDIEIASSDSPQGGFMNYDQAYIVYDSFKIDIKDESAGTRNLIRLIIPIVDVFANDKVLVYDELDSSLHESIVRMFVELFQNEQDPDRCAQLIFSTHNTNFLSADLFRRDQIWFTELTDERATDLYSLVELNGVRKYESFGSQYLKGKYGAIPVINEKFFDDFKNRNRYR